MCYYLQHDLIFTYEYLNYFLEKLDLLKPTQVLQDLELSIPPRDLGEELEIVFNYQWPMIESIMTVSWSLHQSP